MMSSYAYASNENASAAGGERGALVAKQLYRGSDANFPKSTSIDFGEVIRLGGGARGCLLDRIALTYSLLFDRSRRIFALRLSILPLTQTTALDAAELLDIIRSLMSAKYDAVWINIAHSEQLLLDLLSYEVPPGVFIEIPSFLACDPVYSSALYVFHQHGGRLVIKGRPVSDMPTELLPLFSYALVELSDDRRQHEAREVALAHQSKRRIEFVLSGVTNIKEADAGFTRGAVAVLGWPLSGMQQISAIKRKMDDETDLDEFNAVLSVLRYIDSGEAIERIEKTMHSHPKLMYELMRYAKSPVLGLPFGVTALQPAILMLGYQRLRTCCMLVLLRTFRQTDLLPLVQAGIRRGLFLGRLIRDNEQIRDEALSCGIVFTLGQIMHLPLKEVCARIPVSETVYAALVENEGPLIPYLRLMHAMEGGSRDDVSEFAKVLRLKMSEVNSSLVMAMELAVEI